MSTSGSCTRTARRWPSPNSPGLSHSRAQDRTDRGKRLTKHPSSVRKLHVRKRDTRLTPEDKQQFMVQRAAEATERRALFDAATAAAAPPRVRHKASHHNNFFDAPFHFEEQNEEPRTTFCSKIILKMEAPPTAKFMSA